MAAPIRFLVFIVDPVKSRRTEAERVLKLRYEPQTFATVSEAQAALATSKPHAVVFTMRQAEGNGLTAGKDLRKVLGKEPLILVIGPLDRPVTAAQRAEIAKRHGIDSWVPHAADTPTLEVLVWNELVRRFLPREARIGAPRPTFRERVSSLRGRINAITAQDVRKFLTREYHIIPTPPRDPDDDEPGWIELLNSPPTPSNVYKLLTKDLRPRRKAALVASSAES